MTTPPEPIPGARLLFTLDPALAYLNHGGFGAVPIAVQRAQLRLHEEVEANPHRFYATGLGDRITHARRHLSAFLGADPAGTAFVPNATAGISIVLRSLKLGTGDEIVTTSHGYGAVTIAVDRLCARAGATHTVVPIALTASDDEIVAALSQALAPGRTRLLIVDQIASATARVMPVARIASAARTRAVPVLVDAAHAPGAYGTPVDEIGADFWVGNLHKWLFAPRPTALLSVAPAWRARIEPSVVSWQDADGYPTNLEMGGTLDYTAWLAAPTGLFVLRTLGVDRVRAHNAALVAYGQRVVGAALGLLDDADLPQPGGPAAPGEHGRPGGPGACMRVLPLPAYAATTREDAHALAARIADELRVVVAVTSWQGRGLLRVAAQVYNHPDDYDRLATGLPRVLAALR